MLVILGFSHADADRARDLLEWCAQLDGLSRHELLLLASSQVPLPQVQLIYGVASLAFSKVTAAKQPQVEEGGWPLDANALFRRAAQWVSENRKSAWLWLEPDVAPLKAGWLDEIEREYAACGKSFMGAKVDKPFPHFNGVMVYPTYVGKFNAKMLSPGNIPWDCVQPAVTMRHGHNTHLIQRLLADWNTNTPMTFPDFASLSVIRDGAVLYHGSKDGTLIARLRERAGKVLEEPRKPVKMAKKTELTFALPFCNKDADLMLKLLPWIRELNGYKPVPRRCLLSWDESVGPVFVGQIIKAAENAFKWVDHTNYPTPAKNLCAQTIAFRHAANNIAGRLFKKSSWFWMEADVTPLTPDWWRILETEYLCNDKPFMGVVVQGKGHVNGTAVYPSNTPDYIPRALKATWTAWDTAMKAEMIDLCHDCSGIFQHVWGVVDGKFHPFLGPAPTFSDPKELDLVNPKAVLFHRCKSGMLAERLRETKNRLDISSTEDFPPKSQAHCSQCGHPWNESACGPTHALIAGERSPKSKVEIFIVSYAHDIEWLKYCLKSIHKFATGFSGVTLLVPNQERDLFVRMQGYKAVKLASYEVPQDRNLHHLAHQVQKCRADEWCPDADFILFVDSDCTFNSPVTPDDYFVDGKPVLLVKPWDGGPWKPTVDKALAVDSKFDTMQRHPANHHRTLMGWTRQFVSQANSMPFDDYVMSCKPNFPTGFSEFETMGTVAMRKMPKDYHFIDLSKEPRPRDLLDQWWSYSPPDKEQTMPSTGRRAIPLNEIRKALAQ